VRKGRLGEQGIVVQERQQVAFHVRWLGDPGVGNRAFGNAGQELAQEGGFQVGGDSTVLGDLEAKEGLDVAVGHHHAHRRQRPCALALVHEPLHEGFQQHLGAMGRADADHGAQNTPRH
jgi:hypothetical protein